MAAALVRQQEPVEMAALGRLAGDLDQDALGSILVGCPAFFETATGWQLGRPAA